MRLNRAPAHTLGLDLTVSLDRVAPIALSQHHAQQILSNLLSNAFRYTPVAGTIVIRLSMDGPLWVALDLKNPSPPPDVPLREIRKPFVRGSSLAPEGVGLGLTVVEHLTQSHGGRLHIDHAGGVFHIQLLFLRMAQKMARPSIAGDVEL